jgi:hypothetical protein
MHKEYTVTKTGIKIGAGYIAPAKPFTRDEETIQKALLDTHEPLLVIDLVLVAVYLIAVIVITLDLTIWSTK